MITVAAVIVGMFLGAALLYAGYLIGCESDPPNSYIERKK